MFSRELKAELLSALDSYPIATIMGPRQSGKTTLAKLVAPNKPYFNLEQPDIRQQAIEDPNSLLDKAPEGAIIDEIQHVPELLSRLQVIVDERKLNGMYILSGSHQPAVHQAITQSLAGRTAILQMTPLSISEMQENHILKDNIGDYLLNGFLPRIYDQNINPTKYYRDYVQTYLEKDVRTLINLKDLLTFQKFLKLCAGRVGQVLNMNNLANEIGVSNHTVKHWLSIMQASFVIHLLPPYFENFGKRLTKSPKLYFFDVGLAAYLLDIETKEQISKDPLQGNLFENLVVMELYKARYNRGLNPNLYFYRDSQQVEIDLLYKSGHKLTPIEIKLSNKINKNFFSGMKYFNKLVGDRCETGFLVYGGDEERPFDKFNIINYQNSADIIE